MAQRIAFWIYILYLLGVSPCPCFGQGTTTVLPTDIAPTKANLEREQAHYSNLQWHIWKWLPASFYYNASAETTIRPETNPFQFPLKRTLLHQQLPAGTQLSDLSTVDQEGLQADLAHVARLDQVFRINPVVTAGWAFTPNTQVYVNYFLLRDSLMYNSSLNSTTKAIGIGAQHTNSFGSKASLQESILIRELYQTAEPDVLDFLPGVTFQYQFTPNLVTYVNSLLQYRMKHFIGDTGRELNPFHTVGFVYQRGRWTFSGSTTFLQNFRAPFANSAIIPINNYSFVCDFEIARQIYPQFPSLLAIVRAEPVYNFHSHATPGLAGMDFRLYTGLRWTLGKPPLNATMQQIIDRIKKQEGPGADQT